MVLRAVYAYATPTCFLIITTTSELEGEFAPIIITIHLGPLVRVGSRTDEPDI